jgi:uncharacterized membrane protein
MTLTAAMGPRNATIGGTPSKTNRIESIDLLRGIVMLVMALDHVRDYFHYSAYQYDPTDLSKTSAAIFGTRWITHFCAPIFMLLAGMSAALYGAKKGRNALAVFLATRGLWLVIAELFIVTLEWTFNPLYSVYILQVIWAFGLSMMVLAVLVYLPKVAVLLIGILLIAGHNLLDGVHVPGTGLSSQGWALLHEQHGFASPVSYFVGYPILPWIGIIALGYYLGHWYTPSYDPAKRRKNLLYTGLGAIVGFILLRFSNVYGDHVLWSVQKSPLFTLLSFLDVTKYPPSLLYILMTLGPALLFLAWAERPLNGFAQKILVFGRVPMFYYLVHIFVIHCLAIAAAALSGYPWSDMVMIKGWVTGNTRLHGYGFNLLTVYAVWIAVIVALYPLCRWFDRYKRSHIAAQPWLSYL